MGFTTVLLVFLMTNQSLGVQLSDSDKVERYIREIIKQFQEKPTDIKFSSIIQPSADKRCIYKSWIFHAKDTALEPTRTFFYSNEVPYP